jgi:hypothetical protein
VHGVDEGALVVGLDGSQLKPCPGCILVQTFIDLGQGKATIDLGLTLSEKVQVGTV